MLRVGLTGGIACGKSVIGQMMVAEGAQLLEADKLSHELMRPGKPVYEEVVRRFGSAILKPDREVDRAALAGIVFADQQRLQELNSIVHPAVIAAQEQWMNDVGRENPTVIAVIEAALIFEAGLAKRFDKIVVVTCTPEHKLARLTNRMGADEIIARRELERRSSAQIPDEEKVRQADYLIDNSGTLEHARDQVHTLMAQLKRLAVESSAQRSRQ
jgi:dephospho-CoA kinase